MKGLEIHGLEPAGTEPFFTAEEVQAGLRIDSLWGRKVSLDGRYCSRAAHPHKSLSKDGQDQYTVASRAAWTKPLEQTLLDLHIKHLKIENGWVLYNEVKTPLAVEGDNLRLTVDGSGPLDNLLYVGNLDWQNVTLHHKEFYTCAGGNCREVQRVARRVRAGARGDQRRAVSRGRAGAA